MRIRLIRFVPDTVRNEYVHIGVILREQGSREPAQIRFTHGLAAGCAAWPRRPILHCWRGWRANCGNALKPSRHGNLMRLLRESLFPERADDRAQKPIWRRASGGDEELMRLYVETAAKARVPRLSGRAAIQARMRAEFERAGLGPVRKRNRGFGDNAAGIHCGLMWI